MRVWPKVVETGMDKDQLEGLEDRMDRTGNAGDTGLKDKKSSTTHKF